MPSSLRPERSGPHAGMGVFCQNASDFRRNSSINAGSFFVDEICRTSASSGPTLCTRVVVFVSIGHLPCNIRALMGRLKVLDSIHMYCLFAIREQPLH